MMYMTHGVVFPTGDVQACGLMCLLSVQVQAIVGFGVLVVWGWMCQLCTLLVCVLTVFVVSMLEWEAHIMVKVDIGVMYRTPVSDRGAASCSSAAVRGLVCFDRVER